MAGAAGIFAPAFAAEQTLDYNSFTLNRVDTKGEHSLTKYEYDSVTDTLNPVYYDFKFKNTNFNDSDYTKTLSVDILGETIDLVVNEYGVIETSNNEVVSGYGHYFGAYSWNIYNNDSMKDLVDKTFIANTTDGITGFGGAFSTSMSSDGNGSTPGGRNYNININKVKGDFIANGAGTAHKYGGAIYVARDTVINEISDSNFISNFADFRGGAIHNDGTINKIINSNFYGNCAYDKYNRISGGRYTKENIKGGAIYTIGDLSIQATDGFISVFDGNYIISKDGVKDYQAIYAGTRDYDSYSGLILSPPAITLRAENNGKIVMNDKISGDVNTAYHFEPSNHYGFFYTDKEKKPLFQGQEGMIGDKYVHIYSDLDGKILGQEYVEVIETEYEYKLRYHHLDPAGNEIAVSDKSVANTILAQMGLAENYKLHIDGDSTGIVYLNNNIEAVSAVDSLHAAADISLSNTQLRLGVRDNVLDGNNLNLNSGTFNMVNNQVGISALNNLTVAGDTDFVADVDLANKEMDRFTATNYGEHHGNLNVVGMNLLTDANPNDEVTAIYFAQPELKNNVTNNGLEVPNEKYQNFTAYTPIYKYNVTYDNQNEYDDKGDGGYFLFTKGDKYFRPIDLDPENPTVPITPGGNTGNPSDAFNPAVLSSPISSVAASQATINETFKYVFEHADAFTQLPNAERMARINANKYAISTDFNGNRGSLCYDHNNKAAWFRPYATFETMNLKNGPKVDAITYGSLAGFDTDFHEHKHGWHSVGTGYVGYNGSQLSYKGVDTTMNGGVLGYTHTMYKGNFWTALTLSAGASVGESRTMYGKEDFTSLMAGVGSKTGYNFEFKEGKYILQPIMFMSYTFVNTFDYTNAAGVKINADPAHSIQLNPSIRFISNFKNGWQPYASVGMVWNVMNENNVTANNVRLPEMSMKPYVEYGVGVQRNWKDKFTAFGQAMLRNGGRNGIALTAGFRWALGKDTPHHPDKVEAPKTDRTVLKQLSPQQKMALTGKKNTTITSAKAVLKQI